MMALYLTLAGVGVTAILGGMGFIGKRVYDLGATTAQIQTSVENLDKRLDGLDAKLDTKVDTTTMNTNMQRIDTNMSRIETKLDNLILSLVKPVEVTD